MIERVGIVGAGTMGHGIAQVAAMAGCDVTLFDSTAELAEAGLLRIRDNLDEGVTRFKVSGEERGRVLSKIRAHVFTAEEAAGLDLLVEAIPEKLELKIELFQNVETHVADTCILASNTSSLSVNDMQAALNQPERLLGLHFFNPVHINKLVEIVRGSKTNEATLNSATQFVKRIGKDPITVNDSPGFATSRLGVLLGLEAIRMLEQGVASAEDIDKALELGYRHPMGPLKLTDLVGLDVRLDIARYLHEKLGAEQFRPPRLLEEMVAAGKLGKKSGQGFYKW
ncbi:MAG TPA: 3-hydroxyacyl-CoA dehydrogenase family protein [Longimicrobiales bacterium]|nr:3-hydroxyacyl-CoA dehydrogenase family protein [Longimicrobiales bacterium]